MMHGFAIRDNKLVPQPGHDGQVLDFSNPNDEERKWLETTAGISPHDIASALDPDEIGRLELGDEQLAVILKTPRNYSSSDNLLFRVQSLGMFLFKDRLIVISTNDRSLAGETAGNARIQDTQDVVLRILSGSIAHFLGHLRVISLLSDSLEEKAHSSMGNESLLSMFNIEKSLVYYLNGITSNAMVMEKFKIHSRRVGFTDRHVSQLDDIAIDNLQCEKQARIQSDIMESLMATRSSIMNNNMNVLMKRLTIVNVVFMPLNLIAGMGGMSEFSAFTAGVPPVVSYTLFTVGIILMGALTYLVIKNFFDERHPAAARRRRHR